MIWRTLLFLWVTPALAQSVSLPKGALQTYDEEVTSTAITLPFGPAENGVVPMTDINGLKSVTAWHVPKRGSSLQLSEYLEQQLIGNGFTIEFKCSNDACGGYDFRYAIDVVPASSMRIDLRDYHYLLATKDTLHVATLASGSVTANYVQIMQVAEAVAVGANKKPIAQTQVSESASSQAPPNTDGRFILEGLEFGNGSSAISFDALGSVEQLAQILSDQPTLKVILVGHSDATGSLEGNISLSRARANSVRDRLIKDHGILQDRLSVEGVGYLAPRTTNSTAEGRLLNRRVEVVFLP